MAVTWNPADKAATITLSGANLTATKNGVAAWGACRATGVLPAGSKTFFSVMMTTVSVYQIIGIANAAFGTGNYVGAAGANSVGYLSSTAPGPGVIFNASSLLALPAYTSGDVIDCAVDLANLKIWFRKNGGNWNNNPSANPSINTGGVSIAGLNAGPYYPTVSQYQADMLVANFGASPFAHAPPSGFTAVDPTAVLATTGLLTTAPITPSPIVSQLHLLGFSGLGAAPPVLAGPALTPVHLLGGQTFELGPLIVGLCILDPWMAIPLLAESWTVTA